MELNKRSQHKENSKAWWDEKYSSRDGFYYSKEPSKFLMNRLDLLPSKAKVLEIACGEGRNSVALAARGLDILALDFSAVALERAQNLAKDSGVTIQTKTLDLDFFIPELFSFDAIVSVDFRPAPTLLKNLGRGLKQGGHLLMEAHLMEAAKTYTEVEVFECFKPNELLQMFVPSQTSFKILEYSELGEKWGEKAYLIAKKSQLL